MREFRWARPFALAMIAVLAVGCAASEANGDSDGGAGSDTVVAKIGDEVITAAELETQLQTNNKKAWQAWYDARRGMLDRMISERLLNAEVARRGTTMNGLQTELASTLPPATDAEIQTFFNQNQARLGGRSLEEMKPQIEQHLLGLKSQQALQALVADLKSKAGARILLEPPRVDVKIAANDPRKGPEGAPITLVEYSDFQ